MVTVDTVVIHMGSSNGSERRGLVGIMLDVGVRMPAFTGLMGLNLGTGVYIGTIEVEVTTPLPVGVGLGSSLQ